ncbi:MAG: penicillin acylase family protein, partial [Flavobacteriales bacterium]
SIDVGSGIIISANDWPEAAVDSSGEEVWYPGYYKPQYRADRIRKLLNTREKWDLETMQSVMTDVVNEVDAEIFQKWKVDLDSNQWAMDSGLIKNFDWKGEYKHCVLGPLLFNLMSYHFLHLAMSDELGEELFQQFMKTHQMQRCMSVLTQREDSPWWDDVHTASKESYQDVLNEAFRISVKTLSDLQLLQKNGFYDPQQWGWRCHHPFTYNRGSFQKHPLGEIDLFGFYNMSCEQDGGNETIQQAGFILDGSIDFSIYFGSQMRIITDLKQRDYWYNSTPAGQSGHILSKYYRNQNDEYLNSKFSKRFKNPEKLRIQTLRAAA